MGRLTEQDEQGNWCIKGLPWEDTHIGQPITGNTWEKMYGAFKKLLDYENTGLDSKQVQELEERDIAKRPYYEGDGYDDEGEIIYDIWKCPNCDARYEVDYDVYGFCPRCGQRILRED